MFHRRSGSASHRPRSLYLGILVAVATTAALLAAPAANAAQAPTSFHPVVQGTDAVTHSASFRISIKSARKSDAEITSSCYANTYVARDGGSKLYYQVGIECSSDDYFVSEDWSFYSNGNLYAYVPNFGTSYYGYYISNGTQSGGSVGHRDVLWCGTVTDNEGGSGGVCLWASINI